MICPRPGTGQRPQGPPSSAGYGFPAAWGTCGARSKCRRPGKPAPARRLFCAPPSFVPPPRAPPYAIKRARALKSDLPGWLPDVPLHQPISSRTSFDITTSTAAPLFLSMAARPAVYAVQYGLCRVHPLGQRGVFVVHGPHQHQTAARAAACSSSCALCAQAASASGAGERAPASLRPRPAAAKPERARAALPLLGLLRKIGRGIFAARDPLCGCRFGARLRRPAPLFCCCRFLQFSRSYARLLVFNSVLLRKTGAAGYWPHWSRFCCPLSRLRCARPPNGKTPALPVSLTRFLLRKNRRAGRCPHWGIAVPPFSLCSNVASDIFSGSDGTLLCSPAGSLRCIPGAYSRLVALPGETALVIGSHC